MKLFSSLKNPSQISRRKFIKIGALSSAALSFSRCAQKNNNKNWSLNNLKKQDVLRSVYTPLDGAIGDFCWIADDDGFHLFHIYREFNKGASCAAEGQEIKIGHGFSKDLVKWEILAPAIHVREGEWDSAHLWAPSIVKHDDTYYMHYTGMKHDMQQKIGVVTSKDLVNWEYPVSGPVIDPVNYEWAGNRNCRDSYVYLHNEEWLCFYTAAQKESDMPVLGLAVSKDLLEWEDKGFVITKPIKNNEEGYGTYQMESPCFFKSGKYFFLVYTQGKGVRYVVSEDPYSFHDSEVKNFHDELFNFEIIDVDTGLFCYGNKSYYAVIRFGYVSIEDTEMKFLI